jgi:hypothetical protein
MANKYITVGEMGIGMANLSDEIGFNAPLPTADHK